MKADDAKELALRLRGNVRTNEGDVLLELLELMEHQLRIDEETEYDGKRARRYDTSNR